MVSPAIQTTFSFALDSVLFSPQIAQVYAFQVRPVHRGADLLRHDGLLHVLPHVRPGGPHLKPPQHSREGMRGTLRK